MANLTGLLGTMLATGMAGRSRRGPAFASSPFGMGTSGMAGGGMARGMPMAGSSGGGVGQAAGLAALGYLAYKTYQDYQRNNPSSSQPGQTTPSSGQPQARQGGESLGERLMGMMRPEQRAQPEAALGDEKALLLIRAMVAAAAADGQISPDERQRMLSRLDDAGAGPEDHRVLEQELAAPQSVDSLVRLVRDAETAEQVYVVSAMAIEPDTDAERSYLQYLAARLNLDPQRIQALQAMT
ncbi:MAG TPA: tellurite resistance TerB family protein [Azospirillaceae bacterium]|nr:tellurite resistance TerB family protein [Azospirillaceae bacterium]